MKNKMLVIAIIVVILLIFLRSLQTIANMQTKNNPVINHDSITTVPSTPSTSVHPGFKINGVNNESQENHERRDDD